MSSSSLFRAEGSAVRAIASMFFINGCVFGAWSALVPLSKAKLGATDAEFGWLLFAFGAGALAGIFMSTLAIPRLGSRLVLRASSAVLLAAMAATITAATREVFVPSLFLVGLSGCLMDVAQNDQGAVAERELRRPVLSKLHALWSVGGLVGATSGGVMIGAIGGLPFAFSTLALLVVVLVLSQRHLIADKKSAAQGTVRFSLKAGLILLGLYAACCVIADGAVRDWSALYIAHTFTGSAVGSSFGYGAYAGAMALGRVLGDPLRTRFGRGWMLAGSTVSVIISLAIVYASPSAEIAVIGYLLFGLGVSNVFPILVSFAGQDSGASGVTFVVSTAYVAALCSPPLFGWLASTYSLATIFAAIGVPFLVVGLASALLVRSIPSILPMQDHM